MCLIGKTQLLCMQCRGIGPHLVARGKSHGFPRFAVGPWGIFSSYTGDGPSKLVFVQQRQDSCLDTRESSGISLRLGRAIRTLYNVSQGTQGPFPLATEIMGFLSIFKRSQALSPFGTLKSACVSSSQREVRPPVQMRQGPRAFSRVSTGHSDIPASFEGFKPLQEPAFKPLQENSVFFRVRESRCPFHLRQQIQVPYYIVIAERSLLLRCFWKVRIHLGMQ